ncbi:MAG: amino acid adenylation domain-containing protein, partial [bacterium]|nr:amino acid adenylation domain-containing protein [bacterium]
SLLLATVRSKLRRALDCDLSIVDLFQYPTVRSLARHLAPAPEPAAAPAVAAPARTPAEDSEIAIIAVAGRFPGAGTIEAFWRNLRDAEESITFFSAEELLARGADPALVSDPYYVRAGGVVDGADDFDADFFAMTPREALLTDPQHRLFLECAWEALERAGYDPERYPGRIGVFAGAGGSQYQLHLLSDPRLAESLDEFQLRLGTGNDFLASRVSYKLNLKGPGVVVQTACSTSLVAVHLACESLLRGKSDMALAGGATIDLDTGYRYQKGGIMSPDGHCRAFDAGAQGTVGGSGAGIVVLKRLADAVADGDPIHAVIKGSEINNDGAVKVGYTAPGVEGQTAVVRAAQRAAGVAPESIGYVEAHGTGTPLGDPVEVKALQQAFGACGGATGFCALGSVKTNVGHLDAAAGVAGLIKAALALEHRRIPPSLHFERPNPEIDLDASPFYVAAELADWPADGGRPRRAGVSSFGIGGTNAHLILEEAPPAPTSGRSRPWQLLIVSARTPAALETSTECLADHLEAAPEATLADVASTLRIGRRAFEHRRIVVCRDHEDAVRALRGEQSGRQLSMTAPAAREVAFLLPGIGEHYPGMGAGLYAHEAVFRDQIGRCAELARPHLGRDLRRLLFPEGSHDRPAGDGLDLRAMLGRSRAGGDVGSDELERTRFLHPAVFALEYALAKLWMSWGVRPAAILGHSLGEYVAACLAGVLPLADALELVCERARLIDELPGGAMLAVTLPEEQVRRYLGAYLGAGVSLSAVNSPEVSVVAGESDAIAALTEKLEADGVVCRRLAAGHAFHSTMMEPVATELADRFRARRLHAPEIPFLSNVTGDWITAAEATDPDYWARHLCHTVRFADGLTRLLGDAVEPVLLEVGPGHGLGTMALQHPAAAAAERVVVATLPGRFERWDDQAFLLSALGRLWLAGAAVDWAGFQAGEKRRRVVLPTYPFERRRFRIEPRRRPAVALSAGHETAATPAPAPAVAFDLHSRPSLPTAYAAPVDELQRGIAEIWQQLLGIAPVGIDDDYFDLGGNSLVGTIMLTRLRRRFGVELGLERLFSSPTVAGLAAVIREEAGAEAEATLRPPIRRLPRDGRPLPLSFGQERLWFLDRLVPDSSFYHLPSCWLLRGRLDLAALAASLSEIERRQEVLRTVFHLREGKPVQVVRPCVPADRRLPVVDLSALGLCARRAEARTLSRTETRRPFDLECDPTLRTVLLRLGSEEHQFLLTLHHIAGDGWSWNVLLTELTGLYGALAAARLRAADSPLPELPIRYADFALWQRGWLQGEVLAAEVAWWRDHLAGAPVLELPTDRPRPALQRFRGDARRLRLPVAMTGRLEALSRRHGATLFMTVKAAFDVLLWHTTGQRDLVVSTPIANRNHAGIEDLIGFFVNTLALRTRLPRGGATPFAELFAQVRDAALGAYAHQDLPFEILVEHLHPDRDLSRNPIAQVLFALQNAPAPDLELPGLTLGSPALEMDSTRFDLEVHVQPQPQGLAMFFSFDRDLFDGTTVTRLAQQYGRLLEALAENPARRLHELPFLGRGERHHIVVEWNDTLASRGGTYVHERFETQVARTPDAVAVVMDARHSTYRHLNACANRPAHHLQELGVGPDVTVGVALERSPEAVAALVGVLKAGGVYVPLDRSYPAERLAFMLEDAGVEVLLTRRKWLAELPSHRARTVLLDADREAIAHASAENPTSGVTGETLSYLIYTSGSTGRPKGVALVHHTLANLIAWQLERPGFRAGARTLQFAALSFDVSLQEVASTLCSGGTLVVVTDDERRDPSRIIDGIAAHGVERLFLPFVALQQLAEAGADSPPQALREVITAGEQLQITRQVERFFTHLPSCILENQYGPSESHVVSAFPLAGAASAWPALPSIGRPVADFRIYLLNADRRPVPPGVAGELFLSGAGLARGYYGRPALTAEKFLPDPLSGDPLAGDPGARMYATGDLGRFATDGTIEFLGRIDHQIKIRGFRVELGEIEAVLSRHPGVREAAVAVRGDAPGDKRLVAYLVAQTEPAPAASELRGHLGAMLPEHMVPSVFVELEALPLLPSGKVDRRALPAPEPGAGAGAGERVVPRDPVEEILAAIWSQLLGLAELGVHDDFFALGGHSLLATQVQSRIRRDLEVELPLRTLFEQPTVAGLAAWVAAALRRQEGLEAPPLRPLARRPGEAVPPSFAQQRLWFIDRFEPGLAVYNLPALFRFAGHLDRGALARALSEIVRRHEVLRTRFEAVDGVPVQVIEPVADLPVPVLDLSALAEPERGAAADRLASREAQRPFDLDRGPVLRAVLLRLDAGTDREQHVLCLTAHHIAFDGWSIAVFLRELEALYCAFVAGRSRPLPEIEVQYADFAVWQRQWLCGEVLEAQLGYWRSQLTGVPALELPCDRPRPAVQSFRGAVAEFLLPAELHRRLRALGEERGITLFMTLLAGFQVLLGRYAGQRDFAVGTPVANRNRAETEGLIGFFVNTLVLRADLSGAAEDREPTFAQLLARVREVALGAYAHQDLPFEKLVEELEPERNLARNPLIQVLFAMHYAPPTIRELEPGLTVMLDGVGTEQAKFDLTLSLYEGEGEDGLTGAVEYSTDLFDATTLRRLVGHLESLVEGTVADPGKRLSELPWLRAAEQRQLLVEWNDTAGDYPGELSIARLFELRVAQSPEAVAVVFNDESLSYAELNRRANRLAHYLPFAGPRSDNGPKPAPSQRLRPTAASEKLLTQVTGAPELMVAICMERSLRTVVAILAILKAGGVYVPLDLSYPPERLAFMLEDAEAPVLITEEAVAASLPAELGGIHIVCLDRDAAAVARASDCNPAAGAAVGGDQLAYVIYTSGSTGIPKGVAVSHRAVARLVFCTNYVDLGPGDRVAQASTTSFDAATFELWGALLHGGRLVGIDKQVA